MKYAAMTKDEAQRSIRTFCEAVRVNGTSIRPSGRQSQAVFIAKIWPHLIYKIAFISLDKPILLILNYCIKVKIIKVEQKNFGMTIVLIGESPWT